MGTPLVVGRRESRLGFQTTGVIGDPTRSQARRVGSTVWGCGAVCWVDSFAAGAGSLAHPEAGSMNPASIRIRAANRVVKFFTRIPLSLIS